MWCSSTWETKSDSQIELTIHSLCSTKNYRTAWRADILGWGSSSKRVCITGTGQIGGTCDSLSSGWTRLGHCRAPLGCVEDSFESEAPTQRQPVTMTKQSTNGGSNRDLALESSGTVKGKAGWTRKNPV